MQFDSQLDKFDHKLTTHVRLGTPNQMGKFNVILSPEKTGFEKKELSKHIKLH